jgi:hypothetical protein
MSKVFVLVAFVILLIVLAPIATIWSLNTLFPTLAIPFTFDTWMASLVLGGVVGGTTGVSFKK